MSDTRPATDQATPAGGEYDAHYYATQCGIPYERNAHWLRFFREIAERIVRDVQPRRVLDAGCAMGFLVEALRDLGVEAYGVDISEYALSQAREDIKPYLRQGTLTEPLDQRYDLIISVEVLEHLSAPDAELAIANLCAHADDIIFSSTPSDFAEASHVNVRPGEDWAELFARHGMFRDPDYDATYLTGWAGRFRRSGDPPHLVVRGYERAFLRLQQENAGRRFALEQRDDTVSNLRDTVQSLESEVRRLAAENGPLAEDVARLSEDLATVQSLLVEAQSRLAEMTDERDSMRAALDSMSWRLARKLQRSTERIAPVGTRRGKTVRRAARAALVLSEQGPVELARRARSRRKPATIIEAETNVDNDEATREYHDWLHETSPTAADLRRMHQQSEKWPWRPLVSILMPTYDTAPDVLAAAIDSVVAQAYTQWELCVADDASTHPEVRTVLERYAEREPRVKVLFCEKNGGIAAASNRALELATGELIGLLDHDDLLAPQALHRVVQHFTANPDHGFAYSDEDKVRADGSRGEPFFKPDWSPDLFDASNYLCHFAVMRRGVVDQVGGFREGYNGSQDYDLFLRIVDSGVAVGHVPDVLYSWRQLQGSTALAGEAKPYAYEAGRRALEDSLRRRGVDGTVADGRAAGRYQVRRRIVGSPSVSVVIPTRDRVDLLRAAIESIEQQTTYTNYRILIVDNDSRDPRTHEYLRSCGHQVVAHPGPFNYSKIVNSGVAASRGDHVLLLNNDILVTEAQWMEAMLEHSQRPEVGAVGARLIHPNGYPQHEGVGFGMGSLAANIDYGGYFALGVTTRNCSSVTGACMMLRRELWDEMGGLDEKLHVAFNDVDLCLRIRERGLWIVYTPVAELLHAESASRGKLHPMADERLLIERWGTKDDIYDPFLNPNVMLFHPLRLRRTPRLPRPRSAVDPAAG